MEKFKAKVITTSIPENLHRKAKMRGIRWNEALVLGIKHMLEEVDDEEYLLQQIAYYENKIASFKNKLESIRKMKEEMTMYISAENEKMERVLSVIDDWYNKKFEVPERVIEKQSELSGFSVEEIRHAYFEKYGHDI